MTNSSASGWLLSILFGPIVTFLIVVLPKAKPE